MDETMNVHELLKKIAKNIINLKTHAGEGMLRRAGADSWRREL
jgi:hypothetical protein